MLLITTVIDGYSWMAWVGSASSLLMRCWLLIKTLMPIPRWPEWVQWCALISFHRGPLLIQQAALSLQSQWSPVWRSLQLALQPKYQSLEYFGEHCTGPVSIPLAASGWGLHHCHQLGTAQGLQAALMLHTRCLIYWEELYLGHIRMLLYMLILLLWPFAERHSVNLLPQYAIYAGKQTAASIFHWPAPSIAIK